MVARSKKQQVEKLFTHAGQLDSSGKERAAEKVYRQILKIGVNYLPKHEQPCFYLQFGSTLRNTGKLEESELILRMGLKKFPRFRALKLFLALTKCSLNQGRLGVKILLTDALEYAK